MIRFANYNAYIITALYGTSFCRSMTTAYRLLVANPIRTLVLNGISTFLLLASMSLATALTGLAAYALFSNSFPNLVRFDLTAPWTSVLVSPEPNPILSLILALSTYQITVIITFYLAKLYLNVFQVGLSTMFLCYRK